MSISRFTDIPDDFLYEQINKSDIILVDLDGVVFTPAQYLCSSYWYVNYIEDNKPYLNKNVTLPIDIVTTLYECMGRTSFVPVSEKLNNILSSFSDSKTVVGLTGRTIDFKENTFQALSVAGMKFTELNSEVLFKNQSILQGGVIYVGHDQDTGLPWDKGHALDAFLEQYSQTVSSILFIDDFEGNLKNVDKYCASKSFDFIGIHFTKVLDNYENQGMSVDLLKILGEYQFYQLFSTDSNTTITNDHEVFSLLQLHKEYCDHDDYILLGSYTCQSRDI